MPEAVGESAAKPAGGRLSTAEVRLILRGMGLPFAPGLDLPAIFAAITGVESAGDPNAVGDPTLGGAYGLWQVNAAAHPVLAERVKAIIAAHLTAAESARRQAAALAPLMRSAVAAALDAARQLERRGVAVSDEAIAALIDAVWQHGPAKVIQWAMGAEGDLRKIHERVDRYLGFYRGLKDAESIAGKLVIAGVLLGGFGLILWLMRDREGYA